MNLRHSLLYRFLRSIYIRTQSLYDKLTCSQITVHIGDILVPQGEISENQMLVYFRILDAQRFLSVGANDFPLQNRTSYACYGAAHREDLGNRHFEELILSYQKNGYQDSVITSDRYLRILDGTHRTGMNVVFGIPFIRCRLLRRAGRGGEYTYQHYRDLGFSEEELEQFLQIGELLNDRHLPCRDPGSRQCADSDRSGELLSDSLHAGRGQQRDFAVYSRCLCHIGGH